MRFSFMYRPITSDHWTPKADSWKTETGARKAAAKWEADMKANDCPVKIVVGKIENNKFAELPA